MPVTPHLVSGELNIDVGHRLSDMDPNGGSPWDGNRAPGLLNTFVDFLRFFHFALRFWNQTYKWKNKDNVYTN